MASVVDGLGGPFAAALVATLAAPLATMGLGINLLLGWPLIGWLLAPVMEGSSKGQRQKEEEDDDA
ncbi:MAG: hypothetical protein IT464_04450 [Planctomycetes bacterium]|nr:hypothetical protein [Planctomycetota bacterium]